MAEGTQSINNFFYYSKGDVNADIAADIMQTLIQPKRSLFYFRSAGAGVQEYEGLRTSPQIQIGLKYDVVTAVAERNTRVPDGTTGTTDRRAAVSQATIDVIADGEDTQIVVRYIPLFDIKSRQSISIPIGARK